MLTDAAKRDFNEDNGARRTNMEEEDQQYRPYLVLKAPFSDSTTKLRENHSRQLQVAFVLARGASQEDACFVNLHDSLMQ